MPTQGPAGGSGGKLVHRSVTRADFDASSRSTLTGGSAEAVQGPWVVRWGSRIRVDDDGALPCPRSLVRSRPAMSDVGRSGGGESTQGFSLLHYCAAAPLRRVPLQSILVSFSAHIKTHSQSPDIHQTRRLHTIGATHAGPCTSEDCPRRYHSRRLACSRNSRCSCSARRVLGLFGIACDVSAFESSWRCSMAFVSHHS